MEMYLAGVSIHRVEDITIGSMEYQVQPRNHIKSQQKIYARIEKWRNRKLVENYPYVYLDEIVLKRSRTREIQHGFT